MKYDYLNGLIETAVRKEIERQSLDLADLAERHAVKMLAEIRNILDQPLPYDIKIEKILKIIVYCPVPPHI